MLSLSWGYGMSQTTDERLNELKQKYDCVLRLMEDSGIHLQHLQLIEDKLYVRGAAPSEGIRARISAAIDTADPRHGDIDVELIAQERGCRERYDGEGVQNYVIEPGDTLADVSRKFYGNDVETNRILAANRDKVPDPVHLEPGVTLVIPG